MQDADRVPHVQPFSEPTGRRGSRVQADPIRLVQRPDRCHRIAAQLRASRDVGENVSIRAAETKLAIRLSLDLVAVFMDGAVMATTEQSEIRERRRAAVGPVLDMMALAEASLTTGEAAATVSVMERSPDRRRNRAGPGADL